MARARGFAGILLGTEKAPRADEEIDKKKAGSYELTEAERKEKKRLRQANGNAYINLQLSCEELPFDLVSLAKTEELPDGCARDAWERLTSEYDLTEGEDKITLLSMFQQNQLEDVRTNITVWLTSLAIQINTLKKLNHVLDEEYQITHMIGMMVVNVPLGTWYLIGVISLLSLIKILRVVTLAVHKVENGVIMDG